MLKNKKIKKSKIIIFFLLLISILLLFLLYFNKKYYKKKIILLNEKISILKFDNNKLNDKIYDFIDNNIDFYTFNNKNGINESFSKIARRFVELFPFYDFKYMLRKQKQLLQISNKYVAKTIVPDVIINSKKYIVNNKNDLNLYEQNIDLKKSNFKSFYRNSILYSRNINKYQKQYFAEINYYVISSSNKKIDKQIYIIFDIINKNNIIKVVNYKIKSLK